MPNGMINFSELDDFSNSGRIVPQGGIYAIVLRKFGANSKIAYKFKLDALGTYFLATSEMETVRRRIKNFRESLEAVTEKFKTTDYMESQEYMLKYEADRYRSKLATEETLKAKFSDYMTEMDLNLNLEESKRCKYESLKEFTATISNEAIAAKSSEANANIIDAGTTLIAEAVKGEEED